MTAGARFVGQRVARHEDARFLTGRGRYIDDIVVPGTLHAAFVRSDVARGRITALDTSAAAGMPGVVAVLTGAELGPLLHDHKVDDEPPGRDRPFRLFAEGDMRYVGEPIAMVIADSRYLAEDALEAVVVDVDIEEPTIDPVRSLDASAPVVHPDMTSNVYNEVPAAENPELAAVLASAPVVMTETFRQHRYATVPMETRGLLASWDAHRDELTLWISTQGPHSVRGQMARVLGVDDSQVRVIMPDVGGAFGLKMHTCREEIATVLASRALGRPVKWIQDRRENLVADEHCRHDQATVTMAADDDGTLLAAQVDFLEVSGAYPAAGGSAAVFTTMLFPGPYRVPAYAGSAKTVLTNTAPRGAYRGPWMIETVVREQALDCLAARLGMDPLELRRKNVIHEDELPYAMPTGLVYDQMTARATLEQAAELIGYADLRRQQQAWREEGRLIGIGIALFAEPTAMAFGHMSTDATTVRIGSNGRVDVAHTGASHGQSLETTVAQVVADELGVAIEQVRVIQGDTDATPVGPGTGGSRSAVILGTSARMAAIEVRERMFAIACQQLEAAPEDLVVADGVVHVAGTPTKGMTIRDIAQIAYAAPGALPPGTPPGLESQARFTPDSWITWSNACHMCLIEVDRETGAVEILRYVVSEDCGPMINPNVVEGQIAGGVVQGIGGVLYEHLPYDDAGNPLAGTFVDYLLPTATEVPTIEYGHVETPSPTNPGGYKGLGEGGAIGSPPAVINAVADALAPLGAQVRSQPLGPADIVALLEEVGA
ncbi:MAG TPA: xanthine dehydrogenase family protein molybdopterin-binding subunit [Acidimicrobiales bacterium]|nr:xanthine dehydrogenase family protein molybdopterin-binding subunit [Acidimicrobiales bacterium]